MNRFLLGVIALPALLIASAASGQEVRLKCVYTENHPIMRDHGRHVLATIDSGRRTLRLVDIYQGGQTATDFSIVRLDETEVEGRHVDDPKRLFTLNRLTGRLTQKTDCTVDASTMWNAQERRIGFDVRPGQILWCNVEMDCQKAAPIF